MRVAHGQDDLSDGPAAEEPDHANVDLAGPVATVPLVVMPGHVATVAHPETAALPEATSSGVVSSGAVLLGGGKPASLTAAALYLFRIADQGTGQGVTGATCPPHV